MKNILLHLFLSLGVFILSLFICIVVYDNFIKVQTGDKDEKYDSGLEYLGTYCFISLIVAIATFIFTKQKKSN